MANYDGCFGCSLTGRAFTPRFFNAEKAALKRAQTSVQSLTQDYKKTYFYKTQKNEE